MDKYSAELDLYVEASTWFRNKDIKQIMLQETYQGVP